MRLSAIASASRNVGLLLFCGTDSELEARANFSVRCNCFEYCAPTQPRLIDRGFVFRSVMISLSVYERVYWREEGETLPECEAREFGRQSQFLGAISFPQRSAISVPVEECVTSGNDGVCRGRRRDK
jgi:hypothetical protein